MRLVLLPRAVLNAVVCDGKKSFIVEFLFLLCIKLFTQICVVFSVHDGEVLCPGCTIANRERAGVLFKFPKDAKRYVRYIMYHNF